MPASGQCSACARLRVPRQIAQLQQVFRGMAGLAAEVKARSPPLPYWRKFVYCRSLTGEVLGEVDHFKGRSTALDAAVSPEPVAHLSQNRCA